MKIVINFTILCSFLDEIHASFCRFGHLTVDWPHKAESKSYFPPKGQERLCPFSLFRITDSLIE